MSIACTQKWAKFRLDQKHGIRARRRWRKLHLGVDADTHEIAAVELTPDDVGDVSEVPELLDQIDADVASMTADGAYDGEAVYDVVAERHPEAAVIIPPRATAVSGGTVSTQRDRHLAAIAKHGRIGWQRSSGYNRRSLAETAMYRVGAWILKEISYINVLGHLPCFYKSSVINHLRYPCTNAVRMVKLDRKLRPAQGSHVSRLKEGRSGIGRRRASL